MVGKALAHLGNSKTYVLLIIFMIIGLIAVVIAALFGENLWGQWFDQAFVSTIGAVLRAIGVDGIPKAAAAFRDPNSSAANPPPAVTPVQGAMHELRNPPSPAEFPPLE